MTWEMLKLTFASQRKSNNFSIYDGSLELWYNVMQRTNKKHTAKEDGKILDLFKNFVGQNFCFKTGSASKLSGVGTLFSIINTT